MPLVHNNLADLFTDIADEIRLKKGDTAQIVADSFPTEIANLPTGGSLSDVKIYVLDFLHDTITMTAGAKSNYGQYFTT